MSDQTLSLKNLIIPTTKSSEESYMVAELAMQKMEQCEIDILAGKVPDGFDSIDDYFRKLVLSHNRPLHRELRFAYSAMKDKMLVNGEIESTDDRIRRMLRNHEVPMGTPGFLKRCDKIREEMRLAGENV